MNWLQWRTSHKSATGFLARPLNMRDYSQPNQKSTEYGNKWVIAENNTIFSKLTLTLTNQNSTFVLISSSCNPVRKNTFYKDTYKIWYFSEKLNKTYYSVQIAIISSSFTSSFFLISDFTASFRNSQDNIGWTISIARHLKFQCCKT